VAVRSWREIVSLGAVVGSVAAVALGQPVAEAACGKTQRFAAEPGAGQRDAGQQGADSATARPPLVVGDSVMLGAAEEAAAAGFDVDVRGCRPIDEGLRVLRKRRRADRLPQLVVVALGSNSSFTREDVRAALRILGPSRRLGLVTPREVRGTPRAMDDAPTLRAAAERWPRRIALVDWARYSRRRPKLTYSDRIHLTPAGQRAMARLLSRLLEPPAALPPSVGGGEGGEGGAGGEGDATGGGAEAP
jgi:hypothetical protein